MLPSSLACQLLPAGALFAAVPGGPEVAVIGGGIIGTTIAYRLARRGVSVSVIDPAPGGGCTQGAFAMLIMGHPDGPEHFSNLYGRAVAEWRHLQTELPALPIQWGGTLNWVRPGAAADKLLAEEARLAGWGVDIRRVHAADVAQLSPGVMTGPFGAGSFLPGQGAVDIAGAMALLTAQAIAHGARFVNAKVDDLSTDNGRAVVEANGKRTVFDHVVLAAGQGNTALAEKVGAHVPLDIVSGTLAHSRPMPPVLHRVLNGPLGSVKQNPDGRIVTGLDYAPDASSTDTSDAHGRALLDTAVKMVPALRGATLEKVTVGFVPIPAHDQMPIVGRLRAPASIYVASMMSGVTMAPLMARLIASELLDGQPAALLSPYRPERFNPQWNDAGASAAPALNT